MKNLNTLILTVIISISLINCSSDNELVVDDSYLYDPDENCIFGFGTCCDIDGRILIEPNSSYKYKNTTSFNYSNMEWEVLSGEIMIIQGQFTNEVTLKFRENFTKGVIRANAKGINGSSCNNNLEINKL